MDVSVEQLLSGRWEARVAVVTPAGARYFREYGQNRTAALLSLCQLLRRYHGDGYQHARVEAFERALA